MRINLSHCAELSMPKRGCCERRTDGVVLISIAISSTRLRSLMMRLRASSLLIFVAGILASTFGGTFAFIGGKRFISITYQPQKFSFLLVGLDVLCVQRSIGMVDAMLACIMCE